MTINNLKFQRTLFVLLFVLTCCCLSAQSIALRTQINSCVPTVYIDILDGEKDENRNLISTNDANGNKVFKFKNNSGAYVDISYAIIAENPEIIANASSDRWNDYYTVINNNPKQETYDLAVITIKDASGSIKERHELTTIRGRGNSTWNTEKRAFRLKFPSKTKLLAKADGTNEYADAKSWTLIANAADKTLIRNAITSEVGKRVGIPFNAAYKFVDLVINGNYYGTYQISDHIQVNPGRVEIDEKTGWFMEFIPNSDSKYAEIPYISPTIGGSWSTACLNIKNPEAESNDDDAVMNIKAWFENSLNSTVLDDFSEETGYRNQIDIEALVNYELVNEISGNYDGLVSNYAYKDGEGEKLKFGPIWDNDLSYNNSWSDLKEKMLFEGAGSNYTFFSNLIATRFGRDQYSGDAVYIKAFKRKWDKVYNNGELTTFMTNKIDEITQGISCSIEDNNAKWPITQELVTQLGAKTFGNYTAAITSLKDFITTHNPYLENRIQSQYNSKKSEATCTINATSANTSATPPFSNFSNKITTTFVTNRTFAASEWQAICLPFDLDEDELKATFGNGVELAEYTSLSGTTLNFTPQEKLALHAGVPYLIKPSQAVEDPTFTDVVLSIQQPKTIRLNDTDEISFTGTFFQTATSADGTVSIVSNGNATENDESNVIGVSAYIVKPAGTTVNINLGEVVIENLEFDVNNGSASADKVGGTYNITLANRGNLYADGWCTICLPFTITKKNFEVAIGYETKLRELSSIQGSSFNFDKLADANKTMEAGVPYLIMIDTPSAPETTVSLDGITFENTKLEAYKGTSVSRQEGFAFVGILQATDLKTDGTELFLGGTGDKLLIPIPSDKRLSGGKAFFQVPSKSIGTNAKVNIDGVETTAIEALHNDIMSRNDNKVYNLNGQMVGTDIKNMPKGIYIYNGKKIIK